MNTIKIGSKGADVKALQKSLGLVQDGIFGKQTEQAVKVFQKANGLVVDGIVGDTTWNVINKSSNNNSDMEEHIDNIIYKPLKVHVTSCTNRDIKYLAIHYTAGSSSKGGSAAANYNVFTNRDASADFSVDDEQIVQFNPDLKNYYCWAVGDKGTGPLKGKATNKNTISIEICSNLKSGTSAAMPNHSGWYFTDSSIQNATTLTKYLCKTYSIPIENVIRHYDVTGKYCPGIVGWNDGVLYDTGGKVTKSKNNSSSWVNFKNSL